MKSITKNLTLTLFLGLLGFVNVAMADDYKTNGTGNWDTAGIWSEYVKIQGNNYAWQVETGSLTYDFAQNDGKHTFTVELGHTLTIPEGKTLKFNSNNITFDIKGMLIVNGNIELNGNGTNLTVDGNMYVNGDVKITGGGNSTIDGSGTISVGENGNFTAPQNIIKIGDGLNLAITLNSALCAPFDLAATPVEINDMYDVILTWKFDIGNDTKCSNIANFSHFEVAKNSHIIALVSPTKSTVFSYTDEALNAGETPSYSVRAVYSNPAQKSGSEVLIMSSPLPIELFFFDAKLINESGSVIVTWATAAEINNDFFTIEKSLNGSTWEIVDYLIGSGNSNYMIEYSFTDANPYQGISYYRLKQTDFDGKFEYFAPVAVEYNQMKNSAAILNVTYTAQKMDIYVANENPNAYLLVSDIQGRVIGQYQIGADDFTQSISVNFPRNYTGEIVMVRLVSNDKSDEKKYIIR